MFGPRQPPTPRNKTAFRRPPKFRPVLRKYTQLHIFSLRLKYTTEAIPNIHQKVHLVAAVGNQDFRLPRQESSQGMYTWAASRGKEQLPMCTFTAESLRALSKGPPLVVDVFLTQFEGKVDCLQAVQCIRLGAFRLRLALLNHVEESMCINLESTGFEIDRYLPGNRPKAPELFLEVAWAQECNTEYGPSKFELLEEQVEIARQKAAAAKAQVQAEQDAKDKLIAKLRAEKEEAERKTVEEQTKREAAQHEMEEAYRTIQRQESQQEITNERLHRLMERDAVNRMQYAHQAEQRRIAEIRSRQLHARTLLDDLYRLIDIKEQDAERLNKAKEKKRKYKEQAEAERLEKEQAEAELRTAQEALAHTRETLVHAQETQEAQAHDMEERLKKIEEETLRKLQDQIDAAPSKTQHAGVTHVHHHHHHHVHNHKAVHHQHHHHDQHQHTHVQHVQPRHYHHHHIHNHQHLHNQHLHRQQTMPNSLQQTSSSSESQMAQPGPDHEQDESQREVEMQFTTEASVETVVHTTPPWDEPATNLEDLNATEPDLQQKELQREDHVRSLQSGHQNSKQELAETKILEDNPDAKTSLFVQAIDKTIDEVSVISQLRKLSDEKMSQ